MNDFPAGSVRRAAERMCPGGDSAVITGGNDFPLSLKLEQLSLSPPEGETRGVEVKTVSATV